MYSPSLYITTCHARDGVSDTPEHSNDIYLPNSSLIGDPDAVAWLRAARCTAAGRHRASQAAIASTASLHRTPPFQAAKSKALLVLSGRGAAVALVAARRDLHPSHLRDALRAAIRTKTGARGRSLRVRPCPWILQATTMRRTAGIENKMRHARREGVKRDRIGSPPNPDVHRARFTCTLQYRRGPAVVLGLGLAGFGSGCGKLITYSLTATR